MARTRSARLAGSLVLALVVAGVACGENRESVGQRAAALIDEAGAELDDAAGRDGGEPKESGFEDDADACVPKDEDPTMLGFGEVPLGFDDCDRGVRQVAALPIDPGFYGAVVASTGLAGCLSTKRCTQPANDGSVQGTDDPMASSCNGVLSTHLPGHLRGELLPAVEIAKRSGCGQSGTCVIPHGGMPGGEYAFAPVDVSTIPCGSGGSADDASTDAVLVANGYGAMTDGGFTPVTGLPSSVRQLAAEVAQLVCDGAAAAADAGVADAGGAPGCAQRQQYLAAYEAALSMGGSLIVDSYLSNLIGGVLRASATATVAGVDCSKLGVAADFNIVGLPVPKVMNDGVAPDVATDALARLVATAYAVRIGMSSSSFPDLSPGPDGVPMSTFNGAVGAQVLSPYQSVSSVPVDCPALAANTSSWIPSGDEYSGVLGSPNFVEAIPLGSFDFTVKGTVLSAVILATDPCCRPPQFQ